MWPLHSGGLARFPAQFPLESIPVAVLPGEEGHPGSRPRGALTSTSASRAGSEPRLRSVLGTLLLMVAGRRQVGMQNSWWRPVPA